jgi:predicted nucleotidyltransferase
MSPALTSQFKVDTAPSVRPSSDRRISAETAPEPSLGRTRLARSRLRAQGVADRRPRAGPAVLGSTTWDATGAALLDELEPRVGKNAADCIEGEPTGQVGLARPWRTCDHGWTQDPIKWKSVTPSPTGDPSATSESIMHPDPALLDELVRRMVESVHPLRIILFGSAARGEMGPNSDLDTLVVMPNESDCGEVNKTLIRSLRGLGCPKDIVVVRQSDIEQYGDNPYLIIHTALSEGKELYHAPASSRSGYGA